MTFYVAPRSVRRFGGPELAAGSAGPGSRPLAVSRLISQSAASQMRVDHDQDRAAHHPVEGLD
jgi:hypothetical protein